MCVDMFTWKIIVTGMVQGIGYRPYVARLAEQLGICGQVWNASGVVIIMAAASRTLLDSLIAALKNNPPAGACIEHIYCEELPYQDFDGFEIVSSAPLGSPVFEDSVVGATPLIPPDLPVCRQCVSELSDPKNRRFRYPFISCTACGPRYSVIHALPYDRCSTTMSVFDMCTGCEQEYTAAFDIRRHAQTIACHDCGPQLAYRRPGTVLAQYGEDALKAAAALIQSGEIVAVKDIGGFHLVVSPYYDSAVQHLRLLKGREKKPFAVMFESVEEISRYCALSDEERELLESDSRPVVLLKRKKCTGPVAPFVHAVCSGSPYVGAMLYCNPLQLLLLHACGPLIMTSANISGEPIITDNEKILQWASRWNSGAEVKMGVLMHDRNILTPLDDSVVFAAAGKKLFIRRSRGVVPQPVSLQEQPSQYDTLPLNKTVFAAGGDLKAAFCFAQNGRAYLSQHFGDLQQENIYSVYQETFKRMKKLFGFRPDKFVCDLHPMYLSSAFAADQAASAKEDVIKVQHHHAHIASVIAENHLYGRVLGIAFDGTGFGTDGAIWGSEFLWCEQAHYIRAGHLKNVFLPGGDEGAKNTDLSLYGYLTGLLQNGLLPTSKEYELVKRAIEQLQWLDPNQFNIVGKAMELHINTVCSSSMGRLFDAVSALLDICHFNSYEGEAAMQLEYEAASARMAYPLTISIQRKMDGSWEGDVGMLIIGIIEGLLCGVKKQDLARGFINAVGDFTAAMCSKLMSELQMHQPGQSRTDNDVPGVPYPIACSGGCFQNRILLERVLVKLQEMGYNVFVNEKVPVGDGGIALGQAYLAQFL